MLITFLLHSLVSLIVSVMGKERSSLQVRIPRAGKAEDGEKASVLMDRE